MRLVPRSLALAAVLAAPLAVGCGSSSPTAPKKSEDKMKGEEKMMKGEEKMMKGEEKMMKGEGMTPPTSK